MTHAAYNLANRFFRFAFGIALDLRLHGLDNMPAEGSVIIAINHTSFVDPLLVGAYLPRHVVMMSKIENFKLPFFGFLVTLYGAFPVRRGEIDREAIKTALEVLRSGQVLLMAPEGTRSLDGQLQQGRDGLAMIAARTGALVVPFAIAGAKPVSKNLKRLRRTPVTVKVGKPFKLESANAKPSREELAAMTDRVMLRLAGLLPPEQRGVYHGRLSDAE